MSRKSVWRQGHEDVELDCQPVSQKQTRDHPHRPCDPRGDMSNAIDKVVLKSRISSGRLRHLSEYTDNVKEMVGAHAFLSS